MREREGSSQSSLNAHTMELVFEGWMRNEFNCIFTECAKDQAGGIQAVWRSLCLLEKGWRDLPVDIQALSQMAPRAERGGRHEPYQEPRSHLHPGLQAHPLPRDPQCRGEQKLSL